MPGFDRTGPAGQGPQTGRGMGYCAGAGAVGYGYGRPLRMGCGWGGRGRGFRNRMFYPPAATVDERYAELEGRITELQTELAALRQRDENSDNQR